MSSAKWRPFCTDHDVLLSNEAALVMVEAKAEGEAGAEAGAQAETNRKPTKFSRNRVIIHLLGCPTRIELYTHLV